MKNVSAFLKRHSALLLLVLVLATVPAGIAFGKYVKSVKVTDKISITVSVATPADNYTIDKDKMQRALKNLGAESTITELKFVRGSDVPNEVDATYETSIHDTRITPESGKIYAYRKGNVIYIAPADGVDKVMYAPKNSAYLFDSRYVGTVVESLTSISFDNLDTSKVTNMSSMFYQCKSLSSLDLSSFNTSKVTNMGRMFCECNSLSSLDLRNFDTRNVTDMSEMFYMFNGNTALTKLDLSSFNTSKVTTMMGMFQGCTLLPELDVSNFNTSNVTNMQSMFETCKGLTTLDLRNFKTSKVTTMSSMFQDCRGLTSLNVSSFDTSKVTSMAFIFRACTALPTLDVRNFDTSKVTSMQGMFDTCRSLTSLDVSSFKTGEATKMEYMFRSCSSLTTLDLSSFDVAYNCAKASMFEGSTNLKTIYAAQDWEVKGSSTGMNMFKNCTSLEGGNGTKYSSSNTYLTYARIDDPVNGKPGYFTDIKAKSTSSATGYSDAPGINIEG